MTTTSNRNVTIFWVAMAALTVFVYLFGLTIPLIGPDEPRYTQVAREMFYRGDWVTTTLGGFNWFEKPALLYWLQITSFHVFGISEFAARFGSAIFGLGTVASLWFVGYFHVQDRSRAIEFANWLALIAATSLGLIVFARGASFDIILTFPVTAALACFYIYDQRQHEPRATVPLIGLYFFIGVALLAKGLVGAVLPLAIIGLYFVISRRFPSKAFVISLFWGALITLAVAAAWYLPVYLRHGWEFVDEFFIQHHFQRYTSNKYRHPQPFWFFWVIIPLFVVPWTPFFLAGVYRSIKGVFNKAATPPEPEHASLMHFAVAWMLFPLIFFSFSGSKLPGYILPAVPGAIIFTWLYIRGFMQGSAKREMLIKAAAVGMHLVIIGLLIFAVPRYADADSVERLIQTADEAGHHDANAIGFRYVSHNAEYYAAGRLVRTEEGAQKEFQEPELIADQIRDTFRGEYIVIVPLRHLDDLRSSPELNVQVIADNTHVAIAAVTLR